MSSSESSSIAEIPELNSEDETRIEINLDESSSIGFPEHDAREVDDQIQQPLTSAWSIIRVPAHVREVDEKAYNPKIVSIGPFHHNGTVLKAMEAQKMRFLNRLLGKMNLFNRGGGVNLENEMEELERKTRKCYSENFDNINSDDFVQMMLLDGCFIVELLRLYEKSSQQQKGEVCEPIFATRWMLPTIGRDLLMLENQLPMFVLQKIFDLTSFDNGATPLNKLALQFFEPFRPGKDKLAENMLNTTSTYKHLLDLFQSSFVPRDHEGQEVKWKEHDKLPRKGWINNAKTLSDAGVLFLKKSGNPLETEFKRRQLKIPPLFLDDGTSALLRNLIAYEQSNRDVAFYFSTLAVFLNSIVDTPDDVNFLREAGIVKQARGDNKELMDLLDSLTKELQFDVTDCYIIQQIKDINRFCESKVRRIRFQRFSRQINFRALISAYISLVQTMLTVVLYRGDYSNTIGVPSSAPAPAPAPNP